MFDTRWLRLLVLLGVSLGCWSASWLLPTEANAAKVRVRGGSTFKLVASDDGRSVVLRGQLNDDAGASLGRVSLRLEGLRNDQPERLPDPLACRRGDAAGAVRPERGAYAITTDDRGAFCVEYRSDGRELKYRVSFVGNNFFEGATLTSEVIPESQRRAESILRFEAAPTEIDLDKPELTVTASLRVDRDDALRLLTATKKEGLTLTLTDERGETLGTAKTGGDGRARFNLEPKQLAGPGAGELTVVFVGDTDLAPAKTTTTVTRHASARLSAPAQIAGDPDAGVELTVDVSTSHGPVDDGIIEAKLAGASVGAGPVRAGRASLLVSFAGGTQADVPLRLSYVPASPYFRPGESAEVVVRVAGPSPVRQALLALAGMLLVGWIVAKWRRAPKPERPESQLPPPPSGRPEMLVMDRPSGLKGIRGTVTDAHDNSPIAGATVRIELPSFERELVVASVKCDENGQFSLETADMAAGAKLIAEGPLHAALAQALPEPSVLRIALVTRRRALLERLVKWARVRGAPFDSTREPTPGHVRRTAERSGDRDTAHWAGGVERAAFGPDEVTREVETTLGSDEPARSARRNASNG